MLNRYAYVRNNPINFTDPTGNVVSDGCTEGDSSSCVNLDNGVSGSSGGGGNGGGGGGTPPITPTEEDQRQDNNSKISILGQYVQGWNYVGTAWEILNDEEAGWGNWLISGGYILLWTGGHAALAVGLGGLVCVAVGPGCVAAVEGALGIGGTTVTGIERVATDIIPYYPPNQGFYKESTELILKEGDIIARRGGSGGRFFSPPGFSAAQLSLPPSSANLPENLFAVQKPFSVYSGQVAPWFGQIGRGIQYYSPVMSQEYLVNSGYIAPIIK